MDKTKELEDAIDNLVLDKKDINSSDFKKYWELRAELKGRNDREKELITDFISFLKILIKGNPWSQNLINNKIEELNQQLERLKEMK